RSTILTSAYAKSFVLPVQVFPERTKRQGCSGQVSPGPQPIHCLALKSKSGLKDLKYRLSDWNIRTEIHLMRGNAGGSRLPDQRGQLADGAHLKQSGEVQFLLIGLLDLAEHAHGNQRMAAQVEEIFVKTNRLHSQQFLPPLSEYTFNLALRFRGAGRRR